MKKKNIIYIYADDLGRGLLSCYGQKHYSTPHIDQLAKEGMRFTNVCANAFCAPARASLICGIHDVHAGRWSYTPGAYYKKISTGELSFQEVQEILQHVNVENPNRGYIAQVAKTAGYVTGEIGKLEWGFATCPAEMREHGWDYHYGYYDHIRCHGYYPPFLFENGEMVTIEGNTDPHCGRRAYREEISEDFDMSQRKVYSQDLFDEKIHDFIENHQDEPFFLFHPSQLPHGTTFYPDVYDEVKDNDSLTQMEKEYASMVKRLDDTVGKIVAQLEELNLRNDTIILFASDNGHTPGYCLKGRCSNDRALDGTTTDDLLHPFRTETHGDVFNGNDSMAGLKFSNWNGGVMVPFIASCPGYIPQGTTCDTLVASYDTLATVADITGGVLPLETDGQSYVPLLLGQQDYQGHDYVVFASQKGPAIITKDGWKLRVSMDNEALTKPSAQMIFSAHVHYQLYHIALDPEERRDLALQYPQRVKSLRRLLNKECDGNLYNGTSQAHIAQPDYPVPNWQGIMNDEI